MAKPALNIQALSRDERLALIEELWDSLSEGERNAPPLTPAQDAELDRRLDDLERDGAQGLSASELRDRLSRRSP